jgi:hypothetical protein
VPWESASQATPRFGVKTVLGLLGMIVFIVAVISVAATVTWLVVRLTPTEKKKPADPVEQPPAS